MATASREGGYTFHNHYGKLIKLSNSACTAERSRPLSEFNNAVVMSEQPLKDGVPFEVKIQTKVSTWSGSILIGATGKLPDAFRFPASITSLSSVSWVFNGESLWKNGKKESDEYGFQRLEGLTEGDIVGVVRRGSCLHFLINGVDQGPAERELPEEGGVFALVDLYGRCCKVSIVEGATPAIEGDNTSGTSGLQFHRRCGKQAEVRHGGAIAMRKNCQGEFNNAVVLTSRPLRNSEIFEVEITRMVDKWAGSIEMGVSTHSPETLQFPSTMTNLRSGTWMMSGSGIMRDGDNILENFGRSLDSLKTGERVGLMRTPTGSLVYYLNGVEVGVAAVDLPAEIFGVVDLYGQCAEVKITRPLSTADPTDSVAPSPPEAVPQPTDLQFHSLHGENVELSEDGLTASRTQPQDEFTKATVFSNRPLLPEEWFEVTMGLPIDTWSGSIQMGVCRRDPGLLNFDDFEEISDVEEASWVLSGSEVFFDGGIMEADYPLDLDEIPSGSKVGVMVTDSGELHFSFNGIDMGCACRDIPSNVYAAIDIYGQCGQVSLIDRHDNSVHNATPPHNRSSPTLTSASRADTNTSQPPPHIASGALVFHSNCGRNVALTDSYSIATRTSGYKDGVVFSSRQLREGEKFEIELVKLSPTWKGLLKVGLTTCHPGSLAVVPAVSSLLPPHTWMVSGESVSVSGATESESYGKVLSRLQEGSSVAVLRSVDGAMHISVDGQDQGPVHSNIPEGVFAVLDLYGPVQCVRVLDERAASNVSPTEENLPANTMVFSPSCGENIELREGQKVARRVRSYTKAVTLSSHPLPNNSLFQVELREIDHQWNGSLRVGVTALPPAEACREPRASDLGGSSYVLCSWNGALWLFAGGKALQKLPPSVDLLTLKPGQTVGVACRSDSELLFFLNGEQVFQVTVKVPRVRYAVVDLYGPCCEVEIKPLQELALSSLATPTGLHPSSNGEGGVESKPPTHPLFLQRRTTGTSPRADDVSSGEAAARAEAAVGATLSGGGDSPKVKSRGVGVASEDNGIEECSYWKLCDGFIKSLAIPEAYFDRTPQYSRCYCELCCSRRGDPKVKFQLQKKYTVPHGWVKIGLRVEPRAEVLDVFRQWHVAYHGTAVGSVRHILDSGGLLLQGDLSFGGREVKGRHGHFTKEHRPGGFDVEQIFLSPSIKYCTEGNVYSQRCRYTDPLSKRTFWAKVAFKVRVHPDSYRISAQTILPVSAHGQQLDRHFSNSELEWSTSQRSAVILYGLLVKLVAVDEKHK